MDRLVQERSNYNVSAIEFRPSHTSFITVHLNVIIRGNSHQITYECNLDGLVQERCNSSANALELGLSCTNPSRYKLFFVS